MCMRKALFIFAVLIAAFVLVACQPAAATATLTFTPYISPTPEPPTPTPYPVVITDPTGMEMVLVPAGEFSMGSDNGDSDEKPVHTVYLDAFYIDKYEVTNARYAACVGAGVCQPPKETRSYTRTSYYGNSEYDDYPVIYIDWYMAKAYCEWRGARLPTEAEWEKTARGTDGRTYPWGDSFDGSLANFCDRNCTLDWADKDFDDGYPDTAPVGSNPDGVSPYGVFDMAGNVWEWVADWYSGTYYAGSPYENPPGPEAGLIRALRGGAFNVQASGLYSANRYGFLPAGPGDIIGFRCSRSP